MQEPPAHLGDETVRAAVRAHWGVDARARHLPVGFGAHHWRVGDLFVTFDTLGSRHDAQSLEGAYAAAAELAAQGLEFVLAPVAAGTGRFTVPVADGTLSATPWADAPRAREPADGALLGRLHAARPPAALPQWRPLVGPDLADELASRTREPWVAGPHGETARRALRDRLADIGRWVAAYHRHAARTDPGTWVTTHGEPHERNLLDGPDGPLLVDWESVKLAPRERDLRQVGLTGDPRWIEMFDLEWRLDEISQYATWFEHPHGDTTDDRTALGGLRHELARDPGDTATDLARD